MLQPMRRESGLDGYDDIGSAAMATEESHRRNQPAHSRAALQDGFGRRFDYLRMSLTQSCNFRCKYCLPHGFRKQPGLAPELSVPELRRAVRAFASLGLWKVRLTGGEPTIRRDLCQIANELRGIEGVRRIAMTTNGYRLAANARDWCDAGIDAINVSIDTLDRQGFAKATGHDRLPEIVAGVDAALAESFQAIKINSVLMNEDFGLRWGDVLDFISTRDVDWRFIELMRTNDNASFYDMRGLRTRQLREMLEAGGWKKQARIDGSGPAQVFSHPDFRGRIGLIAPYSNGFCDTCNRLRLSSRGKLHLCLFGDGGLNLRDLLQHDHQHAALIDRIVAAMPSKMRSHRLHENNSGATAHLAAIGG